MTPSARRRFIVMLGLISALGPLSIDLERADHEEGEVGGVREARAAADRRAAERIGGLSFIPKSVARPTPAPQWLSA